MIGAWQTHATTLDGFIEGLKRHGVITDPTVEQVMRKVDRKNYVKDTSEAYVDSPLTIGEGQTISAPHMHVAAMETLLPNLRPGAHVLDVGSGSGYLSACFARIVGPTGRVIGIEVNDHLVSWGRTNVEKSDGDLLASEALKIVKADGWKGWPESAPYDAIHVGAAAESVPLALVEQLKNGGQMVIPVGKHSQELLLVSKAQNGKVSTQHLMDVRYVPLVKPHDVAL